MKTVVYLLSLAFFLLYEPIGGVIGHRKFMRAAQLDPQARIGYYRRLILEIAAPSAAILLLLCLGWFSLSDVGVALPGFGGEINRWVAYGVLFVSGVYAVLIVQQIVMARVSQSFRDKLCRIELPEDIACMMPRSPREKRLWTWVSLTAGLFEELLYRGFLFFLVRSLVPAINVYLCLAIMGAVFGLGHAYQGVSGALKTGLYGVMLAALYAVTGSILPGILLHFLNDFTAKDMGNIGQTVKA